MSLIVDVVVYSCVGFFIGLGLLVVILTILERRKAMGIQKWYDNKDHPAEYLDAAGEYDGE